MNSTPLDKSLLLDFFGELLTEKQREYCDLRWNEDYSLAEIAELGALSRQGVWDILHRAEATLCELEEKTGLVGRYLSQKAEILRIEDELRSLLPDTEKRRDILRRLDGLM